MLPLDERVCIVTPAAQVWQVKRLEVGADCLQGQQDSLNLLSCRMA